MIKKQLKGKGICDYDYKHDILFFKTKDRHYERSIELGNFILDLDKEDFIVNVQMLDASEFLQINKMMLREIPQWHFDAKFDEGKIEIRLMFQVKIRNKIIEKNPIIVQNLEEELPNSEMSCVCR